MRRLASDRFWYAQGDGEFFVWLRAHSEGFDVEVFDANVWISQVQGPRSMDVLAQASDEGMPEQFRYFDLSRICIGGQPVVISRTGFTNELGWEFYFGRFSGRYRELAFENPGRLGKWLPASTGDASTSSGAAE